MGPRLKKVLVIIAVLFVGMGVYKQPETWGGNAGKGIDMVEHAGGSVGTFINTVFESQ